jgi:hypothetical protein
VVLLLAANKPRGWIIQVDEGDAHIVPFSVARVRMRARTGERRPGVVSG